jgi:hypothetical protein
MAPSSLLIELDLPDTTSEFTATNGDNHTFIIYVTKGQPLYYPNMPKPMTTGEFEWTISVEAPVNLWHTVKCMLRGRPVDSMRVD